MLVLDRRISETITLETSDGPIIVTLVRLRSNAAKIGFDAPDAVKIYRTELSDRENKQQQRDHFATDPESKP